MIEYFRVAVIAGAAWVYMGLAAAKYFQMTSCSLWCPDYLETAEEQISFSGWQNARWHSARSDLVRLIANFLILMGVAGTGAFPAWFALFPDSISGYAVGFSFLVFFSLILSVIVDWFLVSRSVRALKDRKHIRMQYMLSQLASILCIGFGIDIAVSAFCFPVKWGVSTSGGIAISAAALVLYRFVLLGVRKLLECGKETQEAELSEEEMFAAGIHEEMLRRNKHGIWKFILTAVQYGCIVLFLMQIVWIIEVGAAREIHTLRDLLDGKCSIVVMTAACVFCLENIQVFMNIGTWQCLAAADSTAVRAGYGRSLRSLLIRSASLQELNEDPFIEFLGRNPLLLRIRIPRIDEEIRHMEEEHGREKHSD